MNDVAMPFNLMRLTMRSMLRCVGFGRSAVGSVAGFLLSALALQAAALAAEKPAVRVGLVHSLTGTMAIVETGLLEAEWMAIDEINAAGGVLVRGRRYRIQPVVKDGASDWSTFAQHAMHLLDREQVAVLFGGWTSASRKFMLPVVESRDAILFYPITYEGQECSKNIFYTGATPNQQSEPATRFMLERSPAAGKPFYLVGSDYVFPRTSHAITKGQLKALGGVLVGERYLPLGNLDVAPIVASIQSEMPNGGVIINHFNGDQNIAFFRQLAAAGLTPRHGYYVMSYTILEEEIDLIGREFLVGHYGAWNYLMSDPSAASRRFVSAFQARYGADRIVSDPHESAYNMIYLWKAGVEKANSFDPVDVRQALVGIRFSAPQGQVRVMPNHHLAQTVRIGQIRTDGRYNIVATSDSPVAPQAWNQFEPFSKGHACDWTDPAKGERYRF